MTRASNLKKPEKLRKNKGPDASFELMDVYFEAQKMPDSHRGKFLSVITLNGQLSGSTSFMTCEVFHFRKNCLTRLELLVSSFFGTLHFSEEKIDKIGILR